MPKHFKILFMCSVLIVAGFNTPAHAQLFYRDVTFKESLANLLFQYGKETFYRGIDPQEASFVFQRVLVLNCKHHGAQTFLDKIRHKYPGVSIKISACSDVGAQTVMPGTIKADHFKNTVAPVAAVTKGNNGGILTPPPSDAPQDNGPLRRSYQKVQGELSQLENEIKEKDSVIADYKEQLAARQVDPAVSYAGIAQDQKDLIRIQQSNIDYLKSELAEAKKLAAPGAVVDDDEKYGAMHQQIADSHLSTQEKEMDLDAKNGQVKTLQQQLEELEAQLRLVQEIVNQKNATIASLQEELKVSKLVDQK